MAFADQDSACMQIAQPPKYATIINEYHTTKLGIVYFIIYQLLLCMYYSLTPKVSSNDAVI